MLKLLQYGQELHPKADWAALERTLLDIHREMRRKLPVDNLEALRPRLAETLFAIRNMLTESENMSANAQHSERHQSNSKPESYEFELCLETAKGAAVRPEEPEPISQPPNIPLVVLLKACPDIAPYADREIRSWRDLVVVVSQVRATLGISPDAWAEAQTHMGPEVAATTVAAILQRLDHIKSPGGYLRSLSRKAETGAFSPGPMVMALLRG